MSKIDDCRHKDLDSCELKPATTLDSPEELVGDENTFSDIDDDEVTHSSGVFSSKKVLLISLYVINTNILMKVDAYLHNQEEIRLKTIIWTEMNKEYLEVVVLKCFVFQFSYH